MAIIPARSYKPRDKAKVEVAVLVAERWVMARLRDRHFTSLGEANIAIAELVGWVRPAVQKAGRVTAERVRRARPSRPAAPVADPL